tara:strand:- start:92 stop:343 length:252 start_codon:yes stop_codon:yes gene_type:complete
LAIRADIGLSRSVIHFDQPLDDGLQQRYSANLPNYLLDCCRAVNLQICILIGLPVPAVPELFNLRRHHGPPADVQVTTGTSAQ